MKMVGNGDGSLFTYHRQTNPYFLFLKWISPAGCLLEVDLPSCRPALHAQAWSSCRNLWTCLLPPSEAAPGCPGDRLCSPPARPLHQPAPRSAAAAEPAPGMSFCSGSSLRGSGRKNPADGRSGRCKPWGSNKRCFTNFVLRGWKNFTTAVLTGFTDLKKVIS